jgi:hypothetical protein
MTYAQKLQDPRWRCRRADLIQKAGFCCTECNAEQEVDGPLDFHHVIYIRRRDPWDYPDELLLVLCGTCHTDRQVHDEEAQVEFARMCARMSSFAVYELSKAIRGSLDREWAPKIHDAYAALTAQR